MTPTLAVFDGPSLEEISLRQDLEESGADVRRLTRELAAARAEIDQLRARLADHGPARRRPAARGVRGGA